MYYLNYNQIILGHTAWILLNSHESCSPFGIDKPVHVLVALKQQREKWWWQRAASSLLSWHTALPAPASCLSWVELMQGRTGVWLISIAYFPRPVYHCHSQSSTQTTPTPPPTSASRPAFLKINRSCLGFQMHSNIAADVTARCSHFFLILPIFHSVDSVHLITCVAFQMPHAVPPSSPSAHWSRPRPSAQINRPNLSPLPPSTIHLQLIYFCLGFLSPCLSFPLIRSGAVWKWFWRFSCSVQLPIGDILHSLTFYYKGNTIIACEGEIV